MTCPSVWKKLSGVIELTGTSSRSVHAGPASRTGAASTSAYSRAFVEVVTGSLLIVASELNAEAGRDRTRTWIRDVLDTTRRQARFRVHLGVVAGVVGQQ